MSSAQIQFDFFSTPEESEIESLRKEVRDIKASTDKVRKSLYARNNELEKLVADISDRLYILERNICVGVCNHCGKIN